MSHIAILESNNKEIEQLVNSKNHSDARIKPLLKKNKVASTIMFRSSSTAKMTSKELHSNF
jgi:hypothetical protein